MGLDTFSVVTNGELDGLFGLTLSDTYGVGANGDLTIGALPVVARVVRDTTVLVDFSTASSSGGSVSSSDVYNLSTTLAQTVTSVTNIRTDLTSLTGVVATKADAIVTTSALNNRVLNVLGGGVLDIDIGEFIFDNVNYTQVTG